MKSKHFINLASLLLWLLLKATRRTSYIMSRANTVASAATIIFLNTNSLMSLSDPLSKHMKMDTEIHQTGKKFQRWIPSWSTIMKRSWLKKQWVYLRSWGSTWTLKQWSSSRILKKMQLDSWLTSNYANPAACTSLPLCWRTRGKGKHGEWLPIIHKTIKKMHKVGSWISKPILNMKRGEKGTNEVLRTKVR